MKKNYFGFDLKEWERFLDLFKLMVFILRIHFKFYANTINENNFWLNYFESNSKFVRAYWKPVFMTVTTSLVLGQGQTIPNSYLKMKKFYGFAKKLIIFD